VQVGDLSNKKSRTLAFGDGAAGIDVDQFVSKTLRYLRNGIAGTRRRRDEMEADDDEADVADLDWAHFGATACFASNRRPPVQSFLLGPLSVQKRVRKVPIRRVDTQQMRNLTSTKPQEIDLSEMERVESSNHTLQCAKIRTLLQRTQEESMQAVEEQATHLMETSQIEELPETEIRKLREEYGVADDGGINMFRFALNPNSFSQSVENLFYISFLIRDGHVAINKDSDELPSLHAVDPSHKQGGTSLESDSEPSTEGETTKSKKKSKAASQNGVMRRQAVFTFTHDKWKRLCEAFEVEKAIVPERDDSDVAARATQGGGRGGVSGWYA
jgi:ABC-type transporter Mla MlaB component